MFHFVFVSGGFGLPFFCWSEAGTGLKPPVWRWGDNVEGRLLLLAARLLGTEGGVAVISEFLFSFGIVVALQQGVEVAPFLIMREDVVAGRCLLADALPTRHRPLPFYGPEGGAPGRLRR